MEGKQFFSRANDFGYSKNPEETLEIWDKDKILADVVWVIRKFRPDVIVCRFPTDGGGGHGHHTSSALLAEEAFDLAGDKTKYPEQLKYVDVWQPTRVVVNTGRWWNDKISADDPGVVAHNIGLYNELLGTSYNELAARSRTMHKSQGFGSTGARGDLEEFFEHLKGKEATTSLFDGYISDWTRISNSEKVQKWVTKTIQNFSINDPSTSISNLIALRKEVQNIEDKHWKKIKTDEIDELIIQCAGIYLEAKADHFSKTENDSLHIDFEFINRAKNAVELHSISSSTLHYNNTNSISLKDNIKVEKKEGFIVPKMNISQPYWLAKEGTLGTYNVTDQTLIGKGENDPSIVFTASLTIEGQKIAYQFPLIYKWNDPVKGELYRPFIITPKVTANIEQPIYLFSSKEPKNVVITVKNQTSLQEGNINITAPKGWEVTYSSSFKLDKKGDEIKIIATLTPQKKPQNGNLVVSINGKVANAINTIQYDHIPTQVWFPKSKAKLVFVDIKKEAKKIGYLLGAGDVVPDALRNIGYQVDILKEEDLSPKNLNNYDAILTGVRFLNVNKRSPFMMPKLLKYVEDGGNLVIQYNTRHRMKTQDFGPYPITLSRDRVTEEDAEVTFLKPKHEALNSPNKISKEDFKDWVQERGLYFPSKWDDKYDAILSWHDKNESAKDGALLVAQYGKGNYVYTGISFFRELPAGVPGAYRLLVNLIELGE